jgi:hypothetical protein
MNFIVKASKYKWHFLLISIALIAFWPLSTFQYIPKWDNIDCYLPYRYFVNWSYQNGEWPLWNPFQHFGYPAYADMQNGMYNPIVWIIHLFGNYNTTSLTAELLFYYIVGILGAYKLASLFVKENTTKLLIAISYGLSGFMIGTSQIMIFIAGAAFLPHILFHFHQLLFIHNWKNYLWFAFYIVLHATAASPAFTIILIYVLAILFIFFLIKKKTFSNLDFIKGNWKKICVGTALIIVMLLPFIVALYEFLPYFQRAEKLPYSNFLLENPFDYQEYISFLFPYTTLANSEFFGNTDMTMRSAYIGFIPFLFFLFSFRYIKESHIKWLWISLLFFLLIAAGGTTPFYKFIYELPGFGLFRHPSIFRVYIILIITVLAGISFERWKPELNPKQTKVILWGISIVIGILIIAGFIFRYTEETSTFFNVFKLNQTPPNLSVRTFLFYNSIVIFFSCIIGLMAFNRIGNFKSILLIIIIFDLLIYSQVSSSYTIHYPNKNSSYSDYFNNLPLEADQKLTTIPYKNLIENYEPKLEGLWRNTATFHKKLTFDGHNQTQFSKFNQIEKNGNIALAKENRLMYEISSDVSTSLIPKANAAWNTKHEKIKINPDTLRISTIRIGFNSFSAQVKNESSQSDWVVLNQNFHHLWQAKFNGRTIPIHLINEAFIGVEIPAKSSGKLTFEFNSPNLKYAVVVALLSYVSLIGILIFSIFKTKKQSLNG